MKTCTKCKETKPTTEFNKDKRNKDGLVNSCKACQKAYQKAYYEANREKRKASDKAYYEANRERRKASDKAYYEANRERIKASRRAYREANLEAVREKARARQKAYYEANGEKALARQKAYREVNPDTMRLSNSRRRARKRKAPGHHTSEQWQSRLEYFGNKCRYCGSTENIECEHQIPLSRGGSNWASNLAPACKSCNCSKGTKTHSEYLKEIHEN